jgi:hypothetical protein
LTELAPAPFTVTLEDLIEKHGKSITQMITDDLDGDVETERLTQVAMALRNSMYWQGKQYVVWNCDPGTGVIEVKQASDKSGKVKFSSVYNIFKSDGVKFIGAVSPRAPNVKALPDDDESQEDITAADKVDGIVRTLRRKWDVNRCQKEMAYHAWVTGPIFGLQTYVADGHKYGWTEEPVIELEDVDDGFGGMMQVPVQKGTKRYPKGDVELSLANVLYVTIPYKAKKLSEAEWLRYEYMEHKARLKGLYGKKLEEDEFGRSHEGSSESQTTALRAQHQEVSPSGHTNEWRDTYWRYVRYWLRPTMYSLLKGDVKSGLADDEARKLSEVLEEQYPDGIKVVMVNGRIVDITHERMDDVWAVCKTGMGDRILSDPWGAGVIPIQDDENDFRNMAKEIILRSIPKTFVDSSLINRTEITENDPEIAEVILTKIGIGQDMSKMMGQLPMARMPDQLVPYANNMRERGREIGNVTEALYGGGQPSPTYRGEKQRRDQSMMAFAPFFDETQSFWEKAYTNGIRQLARYGSGTMKVPGENGQAAQTVDLASVAEEGWHIEAEEGIPMSHSEEVDRFLFLLNENNPAVIDKLELLAPINAQQVRKFLGLRGFKNSIEAARNKANRDIQRLLLEPPIPDVDPVTGEVIGDLPSIPIDDFEDDPVVFAQIYREWCLVSQGDRETNEAGYNNVRARGIQYQKKADAMMMPPPGEGGPPPPPGVEEPPPPGLLPPGPAPMEEPNAFDTTSDLY